MGVFRGVHLGDTRAGTRRVITGLSWIAYSGLPALARNSMICRRNLANGAVFRRWTLVSLWDIALEALNESGVFPGHVHMIDSAIARAHHQAAGTKGGFKNRVWPFKRWLYEQKFI